MPNPKYIFTTWSHLRTVVDDKHLPIQFKYNTDGYNVFAVDNGVVYETIIYNNAVPDPSVYSQVQNDSDKSDFLTNYQPTANRVMQAFAARDGYTTNVYPILQGGTDGGGIVRIFRSDTSSRQVFVGAGTAGSPVGGLLTVQGQDADGAAPTANPFLVAGSDGANVQTILTDTAGRPNVVGAAANGAAVAGNPVRVGFSDGTTTRDALSDASGRAIVVGAAADGAAVTGNPVLMGGQDGTNAQSILTDTTGRQVMVGAAADGAAVAGNPVLMGGSDGTNAQTIATDTNGGVIVTGKDAHESPPTANPVLIAGWNGTNVVRLRLNSDGTVATSDKELATFIATGTSIASDNNKSMISILNADATLVTKIHEVYVINVRTATAIGVAGIFELRRITGHSAGSVITPTSMDTADTLDSDITVRTGSTVAGESANLMWRSIFTTDELTAVLDTASNEHIFQTMFPVFSRKTDSGTKPLVLRQNEGLTVKFATNSATGLFDIMLVFTQE